MVGILRMLKKSETAKPTYYLRFRVTDKGQRILQQAHRITKEDGSNNELRWADIPTVFDE